MTIIIQQSNQIGKTLSYLKKVKNMLESKQGKILKKEANKLYLQQIKTLKEQHHKYLKAGKSNPIINQMFKDIIKKS